MTIIFDGTQGITTPTETANNSVTTPVVKSGSALTLQTNGSTTAVTIDTSQRVGIGQTSPTSGCLLDVKGGDVRIENTSSAVRTRYVAGSNQWNVEAGQSTNQFGIYDAAAGLLRMNIDTSGRVTMPYQPGFRVGLAGSTPTIASAALWRFDTTTGNGRFNTGGHYNTSTYTFTAPIAGRYYFHMQVITETNSNNTSRVDLVTLRINGSTSGYSDRRAYYVLNSTGDGGFYSDSVTAIYNLAAGDTVNGMNGSPTSAVQHANGNYSIFEGYLLG